jgi:hypothetical protein
MHARGKLTAAAIAAVAVGVPVGAVSAHSGGHHRHHGHHGATVQHVLLISVDGLHQSDLKWYVANHPHSELARLARGGAAYSNAHTSVPSDSDPGGTALMTGGDPRATGVYYDVAYNHAVFPPGTTHCAGSAPGGNAIYDSPDDKLASVPDFINASNGSFPSLDADGSIYTGGLDTNPALIMKMTAHPQSALNPATFPVDPATCKPIMPWDYLKVNSIFQVIHGAGMRTAWSDKHSIYTSFNGHGSGGNSIDDFFGPEIDSQAVEPDGVPYPQDNDWAHIDAATKQYDGYKVQAIVNEIDGYDHSRTSHVGTPAIFGMNFQTVSVAEKIKSSPANLIGPDAGGHYTTSTPVAGGYQWVGGKLVPGPLLQSALDYVNAQLRRMANELHAQGLAGSTAIIVTAKHGQSPQDLNQLRRIDDGPIITAINAAWAQTHPTNTSLIIAGTDDDLWQSYLSDRSQAAADFVKSYLWNNSAPAVTYSGSTVTVPHSGLAQIYAGSAVAAFFGVPASDPRHPDVFGRVQVGVVYTGGSKIAEHGGDNPADRSVPIVVYAPGVVPHSRVHAWVETTQVAPTILRLLGLNPHQLQAVQQEHTKVLPGS